MEHKTISFASPNFPIKRDKIRRLLRWLNGKTFTHFVKGEFAYTLCLVLTKLSEHKFAAHYKVLQTMPSIRSMMRPSKKKQPKIKFTRDRLRYSKNAAIATQFKASHTRSISKEDWTYFKLLIHKNLHYFQRSARDKLFLAQNQIHW